MYKSVALNTLSESEYVGTPHGIELPDLVKDILKAALLAILAVSVLTGATYILSKQITPQTPPPGPSIDLFTDRGGKGTNNASQPYSLRDLVTLYAQTSNGTAPAVYQSVTFSVYGPKTSNQTQSQITFITSQYTNASGIAKTDFGIPNVPELAVGTWQIIASAKINDRLVVDALTFECTQ